MGILRGIFPLFLDGNGCAFDCAKSKGWNPRDGFSVALCWLLDRMVGVLPSERGIELAVSEEGGVGGVGRSPLGQALAFGASTPEELGGDLADEELGANHRAVGPMGPTGSDRMPRNLRAPRPSGQSPGELQREDQDAGETPALREVAARRCVCRPRQTSRSAGVSPALLE